MTTPPPWKKFSPYELTGDLVSYRTCESCGQGFHQFGRGRPAKRCPPCREGDRYGSTHRKVRAATVSQAVGQLCVRCQWPMLPGQAVQLDHDDQDPTKYLGYSHQSCNARAGAVNGNRARAAAYRAAKGLPSSPNGINSTRVKENPPARPPCPGPEDKWMWGLNGWTPRSRRW